MVVTLRSLSQAQDKLLFRMTNNGMSLHIQEEIECFFGIENRHAPPFCHRQMKLNLYKFLILSPNTF